MASIGVTCGSSSTKEPVKIERLGAGLVSRCIVSLTMEGLRRLRSVKRRFDPLASLTLSIDRPANPSHLLSNMCWYRFIIHFLTDSPI